MLLRYCFGIRSERRHARSASQSAYRWSVDWSRRRCSDHSTSPEPQDASATAICCGRFFETVVARCISEGLVGGEAFAVDASMIAPTLIVARWPMQVNWIRLPVGRRRISAILDDAAFGGATPVEPKSFLRPTCARYTAAANAPAVYAYSDNYLID